MGRDVDQRRSNDGRWNDRVQLQHELIATSDYYISIVCSLSLSDAEIIQDVYIV